MLTLWGNRVAITDHILQIVLWLGVTAVNIRGQKHAFVHWLSGLFILCNVVFIVCDVLNNWAVLGD